MPEHLTTKEFYNNLNNCLDSQGILLSNSVADFLNEDTLKSVLSTFNSVFNTVYYFYDKELNDIFVNQHIILVKKNDLSLEEKGIITSVKRGIVGLNINNLYNKFLPIKNYYIFLKNRNNKSSERDYMETLLKKLG